MPDTRRKVLIEGYSVDELLALTNEQLDQFVFCGEPIVFRAGSAELLGKFERTSERMILELAHIDGGGEGAPEASNTRLEFAHTAAQPGRWVFR